MHTTEHNRLAQLRREHGLKNVDVAAAIGKDQSVLWRYENGQTQIPDPVKAQLAELYGVSRAYLMGWDDEDRSEAVA
jgi:transcriptional regulator with XRE-family HTH domain